MANRLKRQFALAGISSRCYTIDDMDMTEQFKSTVKYKKWKDEKDAQIKKLTKRKGRRKAVEEVYKDYKPSYMKMHVIDKPRLRL